MHTCPHCAALSIKSWRKANATAVRPARCPACGGLSYVAARHHLLASVLCDAIIWGSIALAALLHSWLALLFLPLGLALLFWPQHPGVELHRTDAATVSRARVRFAVELLAIAALALIAYFLFGR